MRQFPQFSLKAFASLAASCSFALAAVLQPVSAEDIAITGGKAYTDGGSGVVENATILVKDGQIVSVAEAGSVPAGYRVVDAAGKWVTTGLMVAETNLGLIEVPLSGPRVETRVNKSAKDPIALAAGDAFDRYSTLIPVTRLEGVTRTLTTFESTPEIWAGQGSVVHLGTNVFNDVVKRSSVLVLDANGGSFNKAGGSRAAFWTKVRADLMDAKEAASKSEGDDKDKEKKPSPTQEVMAQVLAGDLPVMVRVNRAIDIKRAVDLKKEFGIKMILSGATGAWRLASLIADADIPVVVNGFDNLPGGFDTLAATQANAARLHAAGVMVAFTGPDSHNARLAVQTAGNAVANGLPWDAALDALTKNPAKIFGVDDVYGYIRPGYEADLVVWSGDPIELDSAPEFIMIRGVEQPLVSRQTKLRDRYKELTAHPAYVRP